MTIEGTYDCEAQTSFGKLPVILILTSAGGMLNIKCRTRWGDQDVTAVLSPQNEFSFSARVKSPLGPVRLECQAKIEGDEIAGKVNAGRMGNALLKGKKTAE